MELMKKNIHMNQIKCRSSLQLTLDDDFNVPDSKPDIARLIQATGEIRFNDRKLMNGKLYVNGVLSFQALYLTENAARPVDAMRGELPFDESVNLEEGCNVEGITLTAELEDLSASMIHSRKLSLRSLVRIQVAAEELVDEEGATELLAEPDVDTMQKNVHVTSLAVHKKDTFRFREELTLPAVKPAISELLYYEVGLNGTDIRLLENKFSLAADVSVFLIYASDSAEQPFECLDVELPLNTLIDCAGCDETMTPDIALSIISNSLSVRPDADGEERKLELEAVLEASIKIYEESDLSMLQDVYSPRRRLLPMFRDATYENLLLRNSAKLRLVERAKLPDSYPRILQICHSGAMVKLDEVMPVSGGIQAEGVVDVSIFYISSEDDRPLQAFHVSVPFSQLLEVKELTPNCTFDIRPAVEQINVMMLDTEEIEIKAGIALHTIVFQRQKESFLTGITEEPFDTTELQSLPAMTGYLVKPNDSLWEIAKQFFTTVSSIMKINELDTEAVAPGTHLLIVKEVVS